MIPKASIISIVFRPLSHIIMWHDGGVSVMCIYSILKLKNKIHACIVSFVIRPSVVL